jgi:hypothetical protein
MMRFVRCSTVAGGQMQLPLAAVSGFFLCVSTASVAQEAITGTYNGNIEVTTNRPQRWGVTIAINSVEDGKVKGIGTIQQGPCRGEYPIEGTVKDNAIGVISKTKGGASGDCVFAFKGRTEGNRLVGSMGKYEVEFRKQ